MTRRAGSLTRYAAEVERTVEISVMHSPTRNLASCPPRAVCLRSSFGSCGRLSTRHGVRSASYAPCAKPTGTLTAHSYSLSLNGASCCAASAAGPAVLQPAVQVVREKYPHYPPLLKGTGCHQAAASPWRQPRELGDRVHAFAARAATSLAASSAVSSEAGGFTGSLVSSA